MSAAHNLAVHRRWADAENEHDLSHHEDFIHEDLELHLPGGEVVGGIAAYRALLQAQFAGLDGFHSTIHDRIVTDDRVVCRWRTSGTHRGDLFGMAATGKHLEFDGVSVWEFHNGKARRGFAYPDVASILAQLAS